MSGKKKSLRTSPSVDLEVGKTVDTAENTTTVRENAPPTAANTHRENEVPPAAKSTKSSFVHDFPEGTLNANQLSRAEAPIWKKYNDTAAPFDKAMIEEWNDGLGNLLLFTGLFSAILTAFLVATYPSLEPDASQPVVDALAVISAQLAAISASQQPQTSPSPYQSQSSTLPVSVLWINSLWFASLALSIITSLSVIVVQQWIWGYSKRVIIGNGKRDTCIDRQLRYDGVVTWKMSAIIRALPLIIQIAVLLFLAGLVVFTWSIHSFLGKLTSALMGFTAILYAVAALLPLYFEDCPYTSTITDLLFVVSNRKRHRHLSDMFKRGLETRAFVWLSSQVGTPKEFKSVALACAGYGLPDDVPPESWNVINAAYIGLRESLSEIDTESFQPERFAQLVGLLSTLHSFWESGPGFTSQFKELVFGLLYKLNNSKFFEGVLHPAAFLPVIGVAVDEISLNKSEDVAIDSQSLKQSLKGSLDLFEPNNLQSSSSRVNPANSIGTTSFNVLDGAASSLTPTMRIEVVCNRKRNDLEEPSTVAPMRTMEEDSHTQPTMTQLLALWTLHWAHFDVVHAPADFSRQYLQDVRRKAILHLNDDRLSLFGTCLLFHYMSLLKGKETDPAEDADQRALLHFVYALLFNGGLPSGVDLYGSPEDRWVRTPNRWIPYRDEVPPVLKLAICTWYFRIWDRPAKPGSWAMDDIDFDDTWRRVCRVIEQTIFRFFFTHDRFQAGSSLNISL